MERSCQGIRIETTTISTRCVMLLSRFGEEGGTVIHMWGEWMERVQAAAAGSLSETEQTLGEQVLCSRQMEEAIDLWRRVTRTTRHGWKADG